MALSFKLFLFGRTSAARIGDVRSRSLSCLVRILRCLESPSSARPPEECAGPQRHGRRPSPQAPQCSDAPPLRHRVWLTHRAAMHNLRNAQDGAAIESVAPVSRRQKAKSAVISTIVESLGHMAPENGGCNRHHQESDAKLNDRLCCCLHLLRTSALGQFISA